MAWTTPVAWTRIVASTTIDNLWYNRKCVSPISLSLTLSVRQPLVVLIKRKQPDVVLLQELWELRWVVGLYHSRLILLLHTSSSRASYPPKSPDIRKFTNIRKMAEGEQQFPTTMEEAAKAAVSVKAFSDEEFKKAAMEMTNPNLEGYEFFLESMNIKFYRKYREVGLYVVHSLYICCDRLCVMRNGQ